MKQRDLAKIIYAKSLYPAKRYALNKGCAGFDTETDKGKAFVFSYSFPERAKRSDAKFDGSGIIALESFNDFVEFCEQIVRESRFYFFFFYNLEYDKNAIIKHLEVKHLSRLAALDQTQINESLWLRIIPEKCFEVHLRDDNESARWHVIRFYDIAQFFGHLKLDTVAHEILGELKIEFDAAHVSKSRYYEDERYREELNYYAIRDAELTMKLAQKNHESMTSLLMPRRYYSQATISQQYFLEQLKRPLFLPSKSILQYALNCYQGGRFETYKRGYFKIAHSYDIVSAYPAHAIKIPDVSLGKWKRVSEFEQCDLGIFRCEAKLDECVISPLKYAHPKFIVYPHGSFKEVYLTKNELEWAIKLGAKIKVLDAWIYNASELSYPYEFLKDVFEFKQRSSGTLRNTYKVILNGFYGKLIQVVDKKVESIDGEDYYIDHDGVITNYDKVYHAGKLFNPIAANEITANTRCQLLEAMHNHEESIICVATDGIKSEKPLSVMEGDDLGSWRNERRDKNNEFVILGSGIYSYEDCSRFRGFESKFNLFKVLHGEKFSILRNVGLKNAYRSNENWAEFNYLIDTPCKLGVNLKQVRGERHLELNFDQKRTWKRDFRDVEDVLSGDIIESKTRDVITI